MNAHKLSAFVAPVFLLFSTSLPGAVTVWNFDQPSDRLAAAQGSGILAYHDPTGSGWGPLETAFGASADFELPSLPGGEGSVMAIPACTPSQGYRVTHLAAPNGPYGDTHGRVSNFTLILDVFYPAASGSRWRGLYQSNIANDDDAEFYVDDTPENGLGTRGIYHGSVEPGRWHRVVVVMQAAPGEGKCQRFIDGRFVGGIGSTGSGLDLRWSLADAFLLFTDDDGETAAGYVSSIGFVDRAMTFGEVEALGGPHADGALVPGDPAPALDQQMPRRVGVIGHRGGDFCCTPDNSLAGIRSAISNQVPVIEIDTRLSSDGVCMLIHDATVDRTTDGSGAVAGMTAAELQALDAGSWFDPAFAGERIPTLSEAMTVAKDHLILYFDLKVPGQINAIMQAIEDTGFNPEDCWFWTYNSFSDAASIRAQLPDAKIIWGDPPGNWASDPGYFANLRAAGVYGFDLGVYYGTVNTAFLIAAKQEGFVVSIYTILDPDTMVRNAALGVDYMETDFPYVMNLVQPPLTPGSSGPTPGDGAQDVNPNILLTWNGGQHATGHRVSFGTEDSPPFLREQPVDIFPRTNLMADTTYYWRVDAVTTNGVVQGDVWQFTTTATPPPTNAVYEWTFRRASLAPDVGSGQMTYADATTESLTGFGETDDAAVPHLPDGGSGYLRAPSLTEKDQGYFLTFPDSGPNGGGTYINQYSLIMDLYILTDLNWTALFNTDVDNNNDADFYVTPDGSVGIGDLGYAPAGTVAPDTWYRLAFVADLAAGEVTYYLNGNQIHQRTGGSLLDGRFSLYSANDNRPSLLMFNEGDTSGVYTHELLVSALAFSDRALPANEVASLGGPQAEGVFFRSLQASWIGDEVVLTWRGAANVRLQRREMLGSSMEDWEDVAGTLGEGNYTIMSPAGAAFFRLAGP